MVAAGWLFALTTLNMRSGGQWRATILFALPVVAAGWHSWKLGAGVAGAAILCAWLGGAMPEPGSPAPLWLDGLVALAKLALDATCASALGERWRARQQRRRPPP